MKKLLQVAAVAGAVLFSVSVYADQASSSPKQTINVGSDQHLVRIALPANATTGYQWYVSNYNTDLLTLNSYHYRAPTTHRVGAGGTAEFVFAVKPSFHVAPQITNIDFVYGQSWDMNGATSRVIALTSIPTYSSNGSSSEGHSKSQSSAQSAKKPVASPSSMSNDSSSMNKPATVPSMPAPAVQPAPAPTAPSNPSSSAGTSWLTIPGQS
ncbi:MAG: hypothetical protein K0R66_1475 [Gammaproteobacteria bacterium]|jgi:predicted secreted protein|nr:hypothetical protein [Gammaproteobacteria bacterium]